MKLRQIALAAASLLAASSAFADAVTLTNPVYITGASAPQGDVAKALKSICAGTFTLYKQANDSKTENKITYVCSVNFTGTTGNTVYHAVNGGSLNSVLIPVKGTSMSFVQPTACTSTPIADLTGNLGVSLTGAVFRQCTNTVSRNGSDGGFADLSLKETVRSYLAGQGVAIDSLTSERVGLAQAFGLAVSADLFTKLQAAQGLSGTDVPSVSRAEMASIMNGTAFVQDNGIAVFNGVEFEEAKLTYCRRPVTSGTQTSAQLYFLATPVASGTDLGQLGVVEGNVELASGNLVSDLTDYFAVNTGSGTANAISCLNASGYAIGVISAENKPAGSDSYKFVKVNGQELDDGSSPSNQAPAKAGKYDFAYEIVMYRDTTPATNATCTSVAPCSSFKTPGTSAAADSLFTALKTAMANTGGTFQGVFKVTADGFQHNGGNPLAPIIK